MTGRVGLIGWPVKHSVSPAMHNAAFNALGLDWRYDLLPVPPDELEAHVAELLGNGYRGFNVTVPHKRAVLALPQIHEYDPAVRAVEAANTLTVTPGGGLHAANTDWRGIADDLHAHGVDAAGMDCLVLGTGGSAGAAAYALRRMGSASITFASRDPGRRPDAVGYDSLARFSHVHLVVNCTPVGMHPHVDASPWPDGVRFPPGATLYDLVYNPARTRLMEQAEAAGARTIGGLGMLIRQGALAFTQWTGRTPPPGVMQDAAQRALKKQTIESNMV